MSYGEMLREHYSTVRGRLVGVPVPEAPDPIPVSPARVKIAPSADAVIRAVAEHLDIPAGEVRGLSHLTKRHRKARMISAYILWHLRPLKYEAIAWAVYRSRSRNTCSSGLIRIRDLMRSDHDLKKEVEWLEAGFKHVR